MSAPFDTAEPQQILATATPAPMGVQDDMGNPYVAELADIEAALDEGYEDAFGVLADRAFELRVRLGGAR